jgi:thiol-disulfide isomerase/thioredoxin
VLRIGLSMTALVVLAACALGAPTPVPLQTRPASPTTDESVYGPQPAPQAAQPTPAATAMAVSPTPTAPSVNPNQPQRPTVPEVGALAYDVTLDTLNGDQVTLSDLRGKAVMLNFWATWCGPCRIEIPHMIELYDEYRDSGFEILAVNLRENPAQVQAFTEQLGMSFPVALDTNGQAGAAYYVRAIPTTFFLDSDGVIRFIHQGTLSEAGLRDYIERLLAP